MNKVEVGQVLTIASGFDRFITVDRVTTEAWFLALAEVPYEVAQKATVEHFTGPNAKETFSVRHVLAFAHVVARTSARAIEDDVRSAKARGLVERSWPARDRLPDSVRDALFTLRESERRAAETRFGFDELEGTKDD